jgi:hypothetical protein
VVSYTRDVRLRLGIASLLLLAACLPDSVVLAYRFEEGAVQTFKMTARAEAAWDIAGRGSGSYEVSFDVTETVETVDDEGSTVLVEMVPTGAEEHGLPSPGFERKSFTLRLGPLGEVLEVLEVDDIEASSLDQDDLAFIGTYRPSLPEGAVRLRDDWSDGREIQLGSTFQQIETTGELIGFRRNGSTRLARIAFTGSSPLEWITELPQGQTQLNGTAETGGTALIDIDRGAIQEATSSTGGDFNVRVVPGNGAAPIVGTLRLDLELTVERTS